MDQYIGKMLDNRYEILERIGTGGMAVVYKAKCHRLNRLVAVKILKSDLAQDEDFRRRFNAEAAAVAQLSHPNIVSVYDVSRGGDTEYIVMELIDGITLKRYMEKRGQLNWRESLHFITQIMRGLSHAHSRGIVHRDIKPQNVMVLRDGSVKVADFGIACLENSAQTLTQEALGSVHYISPEQARGDRTDARSDIYSAGVVLYEMLTGRLPFEGDSAVSVAIQHLSSIPLAPREINPDIPEQLELICMKAMAPDLDRRYPSADAMIADLEAFRKNPGVSLDFELEDLRPEEPDEPTRPLRTASLLSNSAQSHGGHRPARDSERERRRYDDYDDDYDRPRRGSSKRNTVLIGVASVLAVLVIVVLFKSIFSSFGSSTPTSYVVPDLLGYTEEEAKELPEVKDIFKIDVQDSEFSDEYEVGEICRQNPEEGEERQGDNLVIEVWISAGEDTGEMINVVGQSQRGAETLLKNLVDKYDLTIEAPEELMVYNDEVEAGCVISSDPAEGDPLHKGDTITLVLSKGKQPIPLINFVGVQLETALGQLEGLGLNPDDVTVTDEYSDKPAGEIISQTPGQGAEVQPGDKITFVVSKGPEVSEETGSEIWTIPLPGDREKAYLEIYQNGEQVFAQEVDCTVGNYAYPVKGSGTANMEAYLDGQSWWSGTVIFDGD